MTRAHRPDAAEADPLLFAAMNTLKSAGVKAGLIEEEKTIQDEVCEMCPKLTMQQRIAGFVGCCACGYLISFMATLVLLGGYTPANIRTFVILYIIGNLVALSATAFFVGPRRLCKKMWHKTRRIGTAVWLSLMILVFACAVAGVHILVIILLVILETLAGIWYTASYIPWGRRMIIHCCQGTLFQPCPDVCKPCADQVK